MSKILVSYFSASGVTKKIAEKITNAVSGDLFEIEPVEKYTPEDLDWTNKQSRSSVEMNDKSFRPAVLNKVSNISEYDTIVIGFPVWWYTAPTIINTFIEDLSHLTREGKCICQISDNLGIKDLKSGIVGTLLEKYKKIFTNIKYYYKK